jgi:hypothetical protein
MAARRGACAIGAASFRHPLVAKPPRALGRPMKSSKKKPTTRAYKLTAYTVTGTPMKLVSGERSRAWMDETRDRYAYRCLPLLIANQAGWDLLCPARFTARWDGGDGKSSVTFRFDDGAEDTSFVTSHFGYGVITFSVGYLFQTQKSHNLWVKGPPNLPKDGVTALEGIVETDWAPYTFTMNWKITRPDVDITFDEDEPICRIVPQPRHYLSKFTPRIAPLSDHRELSGQYGQWSRSRQEFILDLKRRGTEANERKWQRLYMHGKDQADEPYAGHQIKLQIPPFKKS